MISQTKPCRMKCFNLFDYAITKICVAIRLAEDGTRNGGIQFQLSPCNVNVMARFPIFSGSLILCRLVLRVFRRVK